MDGIFKNDTLEVYFQYHVYMSICPLISCICITRNRPHLLAKAIQCFNNQTYSNKELIILYESDDVATHQFLSDLNAPDIHAIRSRTDENKHLGSLRNDAIRQASGTYVCQWDDDDWYHPERLQYQFNLLQKYNAAACVLSHFLIYDSNLNNAYLSCSRQWEGSLLCLKDKAMMYPYTNLSRGEDTPVIQALQRQNILYTDPSPTPLYLYNFHGANTWDYNHFSGFFPFSKLLSKEMAFTLKSLLDSEDDNAKHLLSLELLFKDLNIYA